MSRSRTACFRRSTTGLTCVEQAFQRVSRSTVEMNNTPSTLDRTSSVRTSRPSKPYEPPKAGPAYNARLGQDIHKRFRGNPRLQIAMFCKHLDWGRFEEPDSPFERRRRFQMGEVLQLCVTQLASSRIRLQNLADLSQKARPSSGSPVAETMRSSRIDPLSDRDDSQVLFPAQQIRAALGDAGSAAGAVNPNWAYRAWASPVASVKWRRSCNRDVP